MRVRDVDTSHYLVVVESYWNRYGMRAFVDRVCDSLDEARHIKNGCEMCDGISFLIIKGGKVIE